LNKGIEVITGYAWAFADGGSRWGVLALFNKIKIRPPKEFYIVDLLYQIYILQQYKRQIQGRLFKIKLFSR
jgi:hypothetical protein